MEDIIMSATKRLEALISYWKDCPLESPPYVPIADRKYLPAINDKPISSFQEYISSESFGFKNDKSFHYGLLPGPYTGNLSSAKVFILMLNPGLSNGDYHAEYEVNGFRSELMRNLHQENASTEYPFLFLNPQYAWHPGFAYWQSKFDDILRTISHRFSNSYQKALRFLSQNLACLELIAYHSRSHKRIPPAKLPTSTRLMLEFVHNEVVPLAKADQVSIVLTRGIADWGIAVEKGTTSIIQYNGFEARAAYLTITSRGGAEILKRIMK
jgi:hypothetical protein